MSGDRIKQTGCRVIGKEDFADFCLRKQRGRESVCLLFVSLWCGELPTDGGCFIYEELSAVRVEEERGRGEQRREEKVLKSMRESEELFILYVVSAVQTFAEKEEN